MDLLIIERGPSGTPEPEYLVPREPLRGYVGFELS
jgi:hypothetical protein